MDYWPASTTEIFPGLFIGNYQSSNTREVLESNKITAVVSAAEGRSGHWHRTKFTDSIKPGHHLWIECLDNKVENMLRYMRTICDFIDAHLEPKDSKPPGRVLVHCKMGRSRSSTMVIAYLMCKLGKSRDELLGEMKVKWPRTRPSSNFMAQLEIWEKVGYDLWDDEERRSPSWSMRRIWRRGRPIWKSMG
ncbi:hypothetical protein VE01_02644 [Pseudogymnoascus verrucosus]|uniref:protein-tyrosine-phosphatase n=1 Tax=Pseudogymnoascus verrucosus TaxID=342668 RepID=A0A1B8GTN2_9PEZI|nr:uncharacterized protein VE01_02644 [Pseudogymnoascus verrucosus]OBT99181.1 hypothetical protein VE01_02644 [Pseudogymnoascus verrucosus]